MRANAGFLNLGEEYIFRKTEKAISAYEKESGEKVLRLGIGDAVYPLCPRAVKAMKKATKEMGKEKTFRGYPPNEGYAFLREAIAAYYVRHGVYVSGESVFVGDGAKTDVSVLLSLFDCDTVILPTPAYPVYWDASRYASKTVVSVAGKMRNGFCPLPPKEKHENAIVFLTSPNNPLGAVYSRRVLQSWVEYAKENGALILFDAAYAAFARQGDVRSIYEIPDSDTCAIEIGSFSKSFGFTGVRCSFVIIPNKLTVEGVSLSSLFIKRRSFLFNGVSYITQRGAEAAVSAEGEKESQKAIDTYLRNAAYLCACLSRAGVPVYGGTSSPYLWMKCPGDISSFSFFEELLVKCRVATTPGIGFGKEGEGYLRLSAFAKEKTAKEAGVRLFGYLKKRYAKE